jgi:hypothetical protein
MRSIGMMVLAVLMIIVGNAQPAVPAVAAVAGKAAAASSGGGGAAGAGGAAGILGNMGTGVDMAGKIQDLSAKAQKQANDGLLAVADAIQKISGPPSEPLKPLKDIQSALSPSSPFQSDAAPYRIDVGTTPDLIRALRCRDQPTVPSPGNSVSAACQQAPAKTAAELLAIGQDCPPIRIRLKSFD